MKKFYSWMAIFVFASLISCQNEENINGTSSNSIFIIDGSLEENSSRTTLDDNNNVLWEEGDAINAYLGSTKSYEGKIKEGIGKTFARFSIKTDGDLDLGGGTEADGTVFHNVAYYPYMGKGISLTKTRDEYQIKTEFPALQNFRSKSFGKGASPMVAVAQGFNFSFKNVGSIIKFQVKGDSGKKITRVTLQAKDEDNNFQKIAGSCLVTTKLGETPTIKFDENAETTITLDCGEGVELNENENVVFVFAVPPMKYDSGKLIATFYDDEQGYMVWTNQNPKELERSNNVRYTTNYKSAEVLNEVNLIQQAIANGQSSYTLMNDVTINDDKDKINVPEGVVFTLDLGGKTIIGNNLDFLTNNGTMYLCNGKIIAEKAENSRRCIYNYGTITIDDVEFIQKYDQKGAAINNAGTMVINNCIVSSEYYSIWNEKEGSLTINGGTYNCNSREEGDPHYAYLINNKDKATLVINDGTFNCTHGFIATSDDAKTTVHGGNINAIGEMPSKHVFYVCNNANLNVTDCKVKWGGSSSHIVCLDNASLANIHVSGGLYNINTCLPSTFSLTFIESGNAEYPYQAIDAGWKQTDENNYEIYNVRGLKWFRDQVNGKNTFAGNTVKLIADIDLNNEQWSPIGYWETFDGIFDGNGHTISNLKHHATTADCYIGLFGCINNATIQNLTVKNVDIKLIGDNSWAGGHIGAIAGYPNGNSEIKNINLIGDVMIEGEIDKKGAQRIGGIVGGFSATSLKLNNIKIDVNAGSYVKGNMYVGGISGAPLCNTEYTDITSNIDVYAKDGIVGGIVGYLKGNMTNCSSSGKVYRTETTSNATENQWMRIGGIAGTWEAASDTYLTNCSYTGILFCKNNQGEDVEKFFNYGLVGNGYYEKEDPAPTGKLYINGKIVAEGIYQYYTEGVMKANGNYALYSKDGLNWFADEVNNKANYFSGKTLILTNNIDLGGAEWNPIGGADPTDNNFAGIFDGAGYTISNFKVNNSAYGGFFGTMETGTIKNLTIGNATINTHHFAGAILAWGQQDSGHDLDIINCHVKNSIITVTPYGSEGNYDNGDKAGAIVGYLNRGTLTQCTVDGVTITAFRDLGGIVGCVGSDSYGVATITNNTISNSMIIADQTTNRYGSDAVNVGKVIGRYSGTGTPVISENTSDNNVTIETKLPKEGNFNQAVWGGDF